MRGGSVPSPSLASGLAIGLFGGSFNPVHEGHVALTLSAKRRLGLDRVWWLVSPRNPLKDPTLYAPLRERMDAAAARVRTLPFVTVTAIEAQLGTAYTVDTVSVLAARYPATRFVWMMGADGLLTFPRWHRWQTLASAVPIAVFSRPGETTRAALGQAASVLRRSFVQPERAHCLAQAAPPAWTLLRSVHNPMSSTAIRGAGQPF